MLTLSDAARRISWRYKFAKRNSDSNINGYFTPQIISLLVEKEKKWISEIPLSAEKMLVHFVIF